MDGRCVIVGSGNVQDVESGDGSGAEYGNVAWSPRVDVSGIQMHWHCGDMSTAGSASMREPLRLGQGPVPGAVPR